MLLVGGSTFADLCQDHMKSPTACRPPNTANLPYNFAPLNLHKWNVLPRLRKIGTEAAAMSKSKKANNKLGRRERGELRSRMGNFLMFLPNMVRLLGRLLKDSRVPTAEKALFLAAIVYVISPIDLIPDIFPFIGQVDDIYMVSLSLLRLVNRTNADVVREHWTGGGDIVSFADSIASIAPMLLPTRVTRVLSSKVELAPAAKVLKTIGRDQQPLVVEIPQADKDGSIKIDSSSSMPN